MQPSSKIEKLTATVLESLQTCKSDLSKEVQKLIHLYEEKLERSNHYLTHGNRQLHNVIEQKKKHERLLEQQSKMAAMGEMMDAVAHQWKQPLNALSMYSDLLKSDFDDGVVDKAYIENFSNDVQFQIEHMINTLSEFRSFFRPNKDATYFGIKRSIVSVTLLVKDEFLRNNIDIIIESDKEILIHAIENEFKHIILNLINNAKDAFNERNIQKRKIHMGFSEDDTHVYLYVKDNAGGIPENVIDNIFKPNVTTKEDGKGSGIGLYMSTQIAHKMDAKLSVTNEDGGAKFLLCIHKKDINHT